MNEQHPDRESYNMIWDKLINAEINNYKSQYASCIQLIPNVKEEIWKQYSYLNSYCKTNYMESSEKKLDRHKVAACYMIAIAMVCPMRWVKKIDNKVIDLAINETLAITIGLSIVRAFAISAINEKQKVDKISMEEAEILVKRLDGGITLPEEYVNHGEYMNNFANELHYAVIDGKVCILSIAHELFLLEVLTEKG